jgi:hypothetical protein
MFKTILFASLGSIVGLAIIMSWESFGTMPSILKIAAVFGFALIGAFHKSFLAFLSYERNEPIPTRFA